jgi:hypothetical protein
MTFTLLPPLAHFAAIVLVVTLFMLAVSGHFPASDRRPSLQTPGGAALLWGTVMATVATTVVAIIFASRMLPWTAATIAGGAAVLLAPLLLKPLPDEFVDGRRGLVTLAAVAVALAFATEFWR